MSYTEANIVPLEDEDKNLVYPPTVYQAVFNPETGGTLDQEMITSAEEESITDTIPRDADTLGGHTPDYFATNDSLSRKVELKSATFSGTSATSNGSIATGKKCAIVCAKCDATYRANVFVGVDGYAYISISNYEGTTQKGVSVSGTYWYFDI